MFRFSIRDLLWLTVVAALTIALWTQHEAATLWRLRAGAAVNALGDAQRQNAWHKSGIVVTVPDSATGQPFSKYYLVR